VAIERADVPSTIYAVAGRNDGGALKIRVVNDTPRPTCVELAVIA